MPEAVVVKVAEVPGQFVRLTSGVAETLVSIETVAQFVTTPQAPVTTTQYVPSVAGLSGPTISVGVVMPGSGELLRCHW